MRHLLENLLSSDGINPPSSGDAADFVPDGQRTDHPPSPNDPVTGAGGPHMAVFDGITILLAEDSKTNQKVIRRYLKGVPVTLHIAENGVECVDLFQTLSPDVILMDWSMPEKNGIDAARDIRRIEDERGTSRVRIIGLSANALDTHAEIARSVRMDAYLTKPVRRQALLGAVGEQIILLRAGEAGEGDNNADAAGDQSEKCAKPGIGR